MNTYIDHHTLRDAFERTGCSWILQLTKSKALLESVVRELKEFVLEYERQFGTEPDPFALLEDNPERAAAFFETYTAPPLSLGMRITVWRVLHGAEIESMRLDFANSGTLEFFVQTKFYNESNSYSFNSQNIWDLEFMRHVGFGELDGRAFFGGYRSLEALGSK